MIPISGADFPGLFFKLFGRFKSVHSIKKLVGQSSHLVTVFARFQGDTIESIGSEMRISNPPPFDRTQVVLLERGDGRDLLTRLDSLRL